MDTLKRFIHYYKPYRTVFFLDLLCHQSDRSCLPADSKDRYKLSVHQRQQHHPEDASADRYRTFRHVHHPESLQVLRQLPGTYDGCQYGTGYAPAAV